MLDVIADVGGPVFNEVVEEVEFVGVEGAEGFFVVREVAGHGGHEPVNGFLGAAGFIFG